MRTVFREKHMRRFFILFAAAVFYAFLASPCAAAPAVVSVDMQRLVTQSEPGRQATAHLEKVRKVLQKGFDELREAHKKAPEKERNKIYADGLARLNRQMEAERRSALRVVNNVVVEEIEKWRKNNGVSLVISRSAVITGDFVKADFTNTIMAAVNKRQVKFAALPVVKVTPPKKK